MSRERFSLEFDFEKLLNYSRVVVDGNWVLFLDVPDLTIRRWKYQIA